MIMLNVTTPDAESRALFYTLTAFLQFDDERICWSQSDWVPNYEYIELINRTRFLTSNLSNFS